MNTLNDTRKSQSILNRLLTRFSELSTIDSSSMVVLPIDAPTKGFVIIETYLFSVKAKSEYRLHHTKDKVKEFLNETFEKQYGDFKTKLNVSRVDVMIKVDFWYLQK